MPEKLIETVKGRPSIHDRDPNSSQRGKSVAPESPKVSHHESQDSEGLNCTQDQLNAESGSDLEGFEADETNIKMSYIKISKFEVSRSVPRTPERPKRMPPCNSAKTKQQNKEQAIQQNKPQGSSFSISISLVIVVLIAISAYYLWPIEEPKQKLCSFKHLENLYPQQNPKLWISLKLGIESILNKLTPQPAVYLFAHNGSPESFQLVKNITQHSSSCFGNEMLAIEIENADFITSGSEDDYGHVIEKYKAKIKQGNVILIANLNEIPPKAARALHSICDIYSPIANDVVVFLTLTLTDKKEGNDLAQAEDTLRELWESELADYELDALIVRVTDQVFVLTS